MNKSAIRKYAVWARNELRDQIAKRGYYFGIDADGINVDGKDETCVYARDGRLLTETERKQRNELFRLVKEKGFDQVVEEVSYTWFNRLIALRFMEVNDYLPEHIRVLSNANNEFKPEIKTRTLDLEDPHFDKKKILDLIEKNDDEELYRYLLLTECNALNDILPQMFEKIGGYTELLLPNNLLKADSVIGKLVSDIDEEDWDVKSEGGQVQIIGWLYQYYNQELKDQTFSDLKKKNKKISKERIPAATQLFTPDWIVHYMVENSLGRMWIEGHPNDELKSTWKYYLDEAEQEPEVEEQLKEIRKEYSKLNPQDIKFLDPAMGSGHILVVAFDILMQIYESQGIRPREAAKSILENNLYGLDIDDRAAQLAYFAVMMKAREYDRRIFSRGIQPNLYSIQESNGIDDSLIDYVAGGDKKLHSDLKTLVNEMKDAKEYGSIITVSELDFDRLEERLEKLKSNQNLMGIEAFEKVIPLIKVGRLLAQKYEIVCTNPPYRSVGEVSSALRDYLFLHYPKTKLDLFATFIERSISLTTVKGYSALITQQSWMFLSSYKGLRNYLKDLNLITLAHLGKNTYEELNGEVVQPVTFVFRKTAIPDYRATFDKLTDCQSTIDKITTFLSGGKRYITTLDAFKSIPGFPMPYWIDSEILNNFNRPYNLGSFVEIVSGMTTGNNDKYLRYWYEVQRNKIAFGRTNIDDINLEDTKWIPYHKGGEMRKWYGNNDYVVNWSKSNEFNRAKTTMTHVYLKPCITWSDISGTSFAARYCSGGFMFDVKGSCAFGDNDDLKFLIGLFNSKVTPIYVEALNPSTTTQVGDLKRIPLILPSSIIRNEINDLVDKNVNISKDDWDSFETSWDFEINPILKTAVENKLSLREARQIVLQERSTKKLKMKNVEERLNEIYIRLYNAFGVINKTVAEEDITMFNPSLRDDIVNIISNIIGTYFGRYKFPAEWGIKEAVDLDNIIPIGEDVYFEDDLCSNVLRTLSSLFGNENLEDNLQFLAEGLGNIESPRDAIRKYLIREFYSDHCKMYKKRPIYWLFDSGKKNGFKCLIYMHRYTPDTLAKIRTDYVHEQQERYRSQIKHIQETLDTVPKSEQVKMKKELKDLEAKSKEVAVFEEKLHHLADQMIEINLDDGVKHNYALFQDVLAKIK